MAIKAVIFDIGGVIVDADLEGYATVAAPLFSSSVADTRAAVLSRIGRLETGQLDSKGFWKEVGESLWREGKGKPLDPSHPSWTNLWGQIIKETMKINLNMISLCGSLQRQGLIVAALSNTIPEHAEHLAALGTYKPFDPCILSCEVGLRKPDPAIYRLASEKIGASPKECLFIDDLAVNVEGARSIGMATHLFTTATNLIQDLSRHRLLNSRSAGKS